MKTLFATLMIIAACSLQAQISDPATIEADLVAYGDFIFDDMAERTGGYSFIEPDLNTGNWSYSTILDLPSYYSFELVRMDVSNFANKYSDLTLLQGWRPYEDGYTYMLMFAEDHTLLFYYLDSSALLISLMYSP